MGNCSSTSNCNPCGPDFNAINQLATKTASYARQANTYATDAKNAWLEFNALYLGAFAVAPTVDNEGEPLQVGALYWNTGTNTMFVWDGTIWVAADFNEFTLFTATGTTTARNLVTRESDVANVADFGADPTGVSDSFAAIQAACNSGKKTVVAYGTFKVSAPVLIKDNVNFYFEKLIPSTATSSVLRIYGGVTVNGTVDTTAFPAYSVSAIIIDGNAENIGSRFRLAQKTFIDVVVKASGVTGTAIHFKATDSPKAWIMNVNLNAKIEKFERGVYMEQTSTDLSRFITSNYINVDTDYTLKAIEMASSHVNGYGIDGNNIISKGQVNPAATGPMYILCGQDNTFDILPWDWYSVSGVAPYAGTIRAASRKNYFIWRTEFQYLLNNSTDPTQLFVAPDPGNIISRFLFANDAFANNVIGRTNDIRIAAASTAGSNVILDTANATGIHAIRHNGLNTLFIESGKLVPNSSGIYDIGTSGGRFESGFFDKLFTVDGFISITGGIGSPEGVVTAPVGSLFLRTNGGVATTLYVKETGTGNTGWAAK
jgi:hypothetical protein